VQQFVVIAFTLCCLNAVGLVVLSCIKPQPTYDLNQKRSPGKL